MVVAFHWVRVRVYIIERVCHPHAGSFHRSYRGSNFLSQKLSRKLPWDLFLKASVEKKYYRVFINSTLLFTSTKASVEASVEENLLPRKLS